MFGQQTDDGSMGVAVAAFVITVLVLGYGWAFGPLPTRVRAKRRPASVPLMSGPDGKPWEWMLWVGDGMAPAGPHLIGTPVNIDGRTGKVIDTTQLTVLVEWDH